MPSARYLPAGALALAIALPFLLAAAGEDYLIGVATRILIYGLFGLSLNLILGYGGMVSFGHAAFFGLGAYVVGILSQHATYGEPLLTWPLEIGGTDSAFVAWPLAMIFSAVAALVIGAICLRTSGLSFIMITLAFAQMLFFLMISLRAYGGEDGLPLFGRSTLPPADLSEDTHFYFVALALLALALFLKNRLIASRFGLALQGIRDNESRMRAIGFPTYRYKLTAFVISGAVAGLAGALIANQTEFVSPAFLSWHRSGEILIMVILGGMGSLYGPLVGAAAFLLLDEYLSQWTEHWMIILGPVLVLVVLYARGGIWSLFARRPSDHA